MGGDDEFSLVGAEAVRTTDGRTDSYLETYLFSFM